MRRPSRSTFERAGATLAGLSLILAGLWAAWPPLALLAAGVLVLHLWGEDLI